jgi:GxxExxY protein
MTIELGLAGLSFVRQVELPIVYKETPLAGKYKVDMVVEGQVVLELKSVTDFHPIHEAQILTYMRLGSWSIGLILNFNSRRMKDGIRRVSSLADFLSASAANSFFHGVANGR